MRVVIENNLQWKRIYPKGFPSLPRVLRTGSQLDAGHTQSVLRGYFNRVSNFLKTKNQK